MRERTHRNEVGARVRYLTRVIQGHSATDFDLACVDDV